MVSMSTIFVALALLPCALVSAAWPPIEDFQTGFTGWHDEQGIPVTTVSECSNASFSHLGGLNVLGSGSSLNKNFSDLPLHNGLTIYLELVAVDSWDFEVLSVLVDGVLQFQSGEIKSRIGEGQVCSGNFGDTLVHAVIHLPDHEARDIAISITSNLNQQHHDEAFGLARLEFLGDSDYTTVTTTMTSTPTTTAMQPFLPSEDFGSDSGYWTGTSGKTSFAACGPKTILQESGSPGGFLQATYDNLLVTEGGLLVEFSLLFIDDWADNEVFISINGVQRWASGPITPRGLHRSICGGSEKEVSKLGRIILQNYSSSEMTIHITSNLGIDAEDQTRSFGLDQLTVKPLPTSTQCAAETRDGVEWPVTDSNVEVTAACPDGFAGEYYRKCQAGLWKQPIFNCSADFLDTNTSDPVEFVRRASRFLKKNIGLFFSEDQANLLVQTTTQALANLENAEVEEVREAGTAVLSVLSTIGETRSEVLNSVDPSVAQQPDDLTRTLLRALARDDNSSIVDLEAEDVALTARKANFSSGPVRMIMAGATMDFPKELKNGEDSTTLSFLLSTPALMESVNTVELPNSPMLTINAFGMSEGYNKLDNTFTFTMSLNLEDMTQLLEDATENAIDPESLELVRTGAGDLELCGEGVESGAEQTCEPVVVQCRWFDFTVNSWGDEGCSVAGVTAGGEVTCACNHLTNFALVIRGGSSGLTKTERTLLDLLTDVGLGISIFCLLLLVVCFLLVWQSKAVETPQHILLNMCLALMGAQICFYFGIDIEDDVICKGVAAALHFFFLASFFWTLVQSFALHQAFIAVFTNTTPEQVYNRGFIFAWGVPLVCVISGMAVSSSDYTTSSFCWIDPASLIFKATFLGPLAVVLACNIVVFVLVIIRLRKHAKTKAVHFRASVSFFMLLGLSWILAIPVYVHDWVGWQFLFVLASCFQGVLLLYFNLFRSRALKGMLYRRITLQSVTPETSIESSNPNNKKSRAKKESAPSKRVTITSDSNAEDIRGAPFFNTGVGKRVLRFAVGDLETYSTDDYDAGETRCNPLYTEEEKTDDIFALAPPVRDCYVSVQASSFAGSESEGEEGSDDDADRKLSRGIIIGRSVRRRGGDVLEEDDAGLPGTTSSHEASEAPVPAEEYEGNDDECDEEEEEYDELHLGESQDEESDDETSSATPVEDPYAYAEQLK